LELVRNGLTSKARRAIQLMRSYS